MTYLNRKELHIPGYYWWLPDYLNERAHENECWSIVSFHPANRDFQYAGVFVGPLETPARATSPV